MQAGTNSALLLTAGQEICIVAPAALIFRRVSPVTDPALPCFQAI